MFLVLGLFTVTLDAVSRRVGKYAKLDRFVQLMNALRTFFSLSVRRKNRGRRLRAIKALTFPKAFDALALHCEDVAPRLWHKMAAPVGILFFFPY